MTAHTALRLFDEAPPSGRRPSLTVEQAAAVARRSGSLLLAASAGSGKTSVLVERFVAAVLDDGVAPGRILAITFTERAAGELRLRVRARFSELGAREAARDTEAAFVLTIHGFCARLLRAHALAAGVDPAFVVLDDDSARRLRSEAFGEALGELVGRGGDSEGLDLAAAYGPDALERMILAVHEELRSRGHTLPALPPIDAVTVAPGHRAPLVRARASLEAELAKRLTGDGSPSATIERAWAAVQRGAELFEREGPGEVPLPALLASLRLPGGSSDAVSSEAARAYTQAHDAYQQACVDHHAARACVLLNRLLGAYGVAYARRKHARSAVDFDDLELLARDLLMSQPAVGQAWSERFELVMVDEFQDSNARQVQILEALERDNLFTVGDEAQSIYSFRHADVGIFRARRRRLGSAGAAGALAENFRSRPPLLKAVNAVFAERFAPAFVPLRAGLTADPPGSDQALVELLITDAGAWGATRGEAGSEPAMTWREAEAELLAARVAELVTGGQVHAGQVAVLVRATGDLAVYERALRQRGLDTLAAAGGGYWGRQEVVDLTAHLTALANPLDEPSLYASLASPLGGLSSDALALIGLDERERGGGAWEAVQRLASEETETVVSPPDRPRAEHPADGAREFDARDRARLRSWQAFFASERAGAPRASPSQLLARALRWCPALAPGERPLANAHKLMRIARDFEALQGGDLRQFVEHLRDRGGHDTREVDAPVQTAAPEAVRMMTIHAAKGLEFDVVCVADLGRQGRIDMPALLVEGDRVGLRLNSLDGGEPAAALAYDDLRARRVAAQAQEEERIFYVALTRARERLLLSGGIDLAHWPSPRPGAAPLSWLGPALVPGLRERLDSAAPVQELDSQVGPHRFRVRCLLNTPATLPDLVGPWRQVPRVASSPVDPPRACAPPAPPPIASPPATAPAPAPAPSSLSYSALAEYQRCGYRYYLQRVVGLADEGTRAVRSDDHHGAPDARTRGALTHALLEDLDFSRPLAPTEARARRIAASLGASIDSASLSDARRLVDDFVASAMGERLRAARRVRREHRFAIPLGGPDEPLLTGVLDVLADEGDGQLLVVDYKTDRVEGVDLEEHVDGAYAVQRALYALAALAGEADRVEVVYCYLSRPGEPVGASFQAADAGALRQRMRQLSAGVLAGAFPVARAPHRGLCLSCPGRRRLCSWPESATLREKAAAQGPQMP